MHVCGKVADCGADARVEGAAVGEVAAEAHARCADAAIAGGQGVQEGGRELGVFVVGREFLARVREG